MSTDRSLRRKRNATEVAESNVQNQMNEQQNEVFIKVRGMCGWGISEFKLWVLFFFTTFMLSSHLKVPVGITRSFAIDWDEVNMGSPV